MSENKSSKSKEVINTNRLQKQLNTLKKEVMQQPQLEAAIPARKRMKIAREANYKQVQQHVGKYIPQVKQNREKDFVDFTTSDKILNGNEVKLNSMNQIASNYTEKRIESQLEK